MKTAQKSLVSLVLLVIIISSVGASVAWEPYFGFSKGKSKIEDDRIPFYELTLGTSIGSRVSVESFIMAQPLSEFPINSSDAYNSEMEYAFAIISGVKTSLTLFKDATFNPMVQASLGQMLIASAESTENQPDFSWSFYSSIATGFELNLFESFKILILSGYSFAPHNQVIGIESNALSTKFSSISFRANLV